MTEYWFARYKPGLPQNAGRGLLVVRWQGLAVILGFVASFLIGVACFFIGAFTDEAPLGIALWVVCIIIGGSFFLWASVARTDPVKPASEYLAEKQARRAATRQSA